MESPPYILCKNHNKNMVSCQSILGKFTKLGSWNKPAQGMGSFPCGDLERIENQRKIHSFPQDPPGRAQRTGSTGV